jgi:hypothetical protein
MSNPDVEVIGMLPPELQPTTTIPPASRQTQKSLARPMR